MTRRDLMRWSSWRYTASDEDLSWEWDKFYQASHQAGATTECYALISPERLEGLMCVDIQPEATPDGNALVIVYLATNPANRSKTKGHADVGKALIGAAVLRSKDLGFNGRLWLESLPGAIEAYLAIGFIETGRVSSDDLPIYELDAERADQLLAAIKSRGIVLL